MNEIFSITDVGDKENSHFFANLPSCLSSPLSVATKKRKRSPSKDNITKKEHCKKKQKREGTAPYVASSFYCNEELPETIPDIENMHSTPEKKESISPLRDLHAWLGTELHTIDVSPNSLLTMFNTDNMFPDGQNDVHPLMDTFLDESPIPLLPPSVSDVPYPKISYLEDTSSENPSLDEILAEVSSPTHDKSPERATSTPVPPLLPLQTSTDALLPYRMQRPPISYRNDIQHCDMIRVTWLTNSRAGWCPIIPFPRAISKEKKLLIEPVQIQTPDLRLSVQIVTNGEQQLFCAMHGNEGSQVEVPIQRTMDNQASASNSFTPNESGHEILLNCKYIRPSQNSRRPLHHIIITDNYGRQLLDWSVELFNKKWETMTKSQDKPTPENTCTIVWSVNNEWKITTKPLAPSVGRGVM